MSREELRTHGTSVESSGPRSSSYYLGVDCIGPPGSISKSSRCRYQSTAEGTKAREGSGPRQTGLRRKTASYTQNPTISSSVSISVFREENLQCRSPSSPRPIAPSEEDDRRSRLDQSPALTLVSRDRDRLHRSASRQPTRSTSLLHYQSPCRGTMRIRPRTSVARICRHRSPQ